MTTSGSRRPLGDSHEGFPGLKVECGNFALTGRDGIFPPKDGDAGILPPPPVYDGSGEGPNVAPSDDSGYCEPGTGSGPILPIDVDGRGLGSGPQG